MTTALALTAQSTIINGQGLAVSANLLSQITTFQSHAPITSIANCFSTISSADANIAANIITSLFNIGAGVTKGQWLIDYYPPNITPVSTAGISCRYTYVIPVYGTGLHSTEIVGNTYVPVANTASVSHTITNQAQLPFAYGIQGFANVFSTVDGYANSVFDTVSSVYMLRGKTYGQSGLTYTGSKDLATGGISDNNILLASIVKDWGTMYDIANINTFSDPYVFGQNLLNQGFGNYGNLTVNLQAAGLNITNLLQVPQSTTTTTQLPGSVTTSTPIGAVDIPTTIVETTTTTVVGNSVDTLLSIYRKVTGSELSTIIAAAGITITNPDIKTLADFLDFNKVIDITNISKLSQLGITTFTGLSQFLQLKIGQGYFRSWQDLAILLENLEIPTLNYTTATSTDLVISNSLATNLLNTLGTGSGPFQNPTLQDYLGAVSGIPYTSVFQLLNQNYNAVASSINLSTLTTNLDNEVSNYINQSAANLSPTSTNIDNAVLAINFALNSLIPSDTFVTCQSEFFYMLNHLTNEVNNLPKTGIVFNAGNGQILNSFSQRMPRNATDKDQFYLYQFFANLITNDTAGDTIRSAIAEEINLQLLRSAGITLHNDPNPRLALSQAQSQHIPISTYLLQNK